MYKKNEIKEIRKQLIIKRQVVKWHQEDIRALEKRLEEARKEGKR